MQDIFNFAQDGAIDKVRQALLDGANIQETNKKDANQSLLHYATQYGYEELVAFLLEHKINPNIVDDYGVSALHKAAGKGYISIVKQLVEHGAVVDIQNNKKATPFNEALYNNQIDCAEFLLNKGANVDNAYDTLYDEGFTSLFFAIGGRFEYSKNVVKFLIKHGASVDIMDGNGNLLLANAINQNTLTAELVKASSNINLQDKNGKTALHHAASCDGIEPLKKLLKRKDINFEILDKDGRAPLYYSKYAAGAALLINSGAAYDKTKEYDELFWRLYGDKHIDLKKLNELISSGEKVQFDITTLSKQVINSIKLFAKNHPDEIFYAFAIEGDSLSLNSEDGFEKTLKRYQEKLPELYFDTGNIELLKYNVGNFEYQGFSFLGDGFVSHLYEEHLRMDDAENHKSAYSKAMTELLKELLKKNAFAPLKISKDFKLIIAEHTY